jgi:hypothetical protein
MRVSILEARFKVSCLEFVQLLKAVFCHYRTRIVRLVLVFFNGIRIADLLGNLIFEYRLEVLFNLLKAIFAAI